MAPKLGHSTSRTGSLRVPCPSNTVDMDQTVDVRTNRIVFAIEIREFLQESINGGCSRHTHGAESN